MTQRLLSVLSQIRLRTALSTCALILCFGDEARAACTSPAAEAGAREYFTGDNRYRLCDGTNWLDLLSDGTLGACSNAGRFEFDTGSGAYRYCAGTVWHKLGGMQGLGACTLNRAIQYFSAEKALAFCDGSNWQVMARGTSISCPAGYIPVPPVSPYTSTEFCVAKFQMKNVSGTPTSQAANAPWTNINRNNARTQCSNLGANYRLIDNAQWQTLARNIVLVGWNWSSGVVGTGALNRGHSDGTPASPLAASTNDNNACQGTGQTCSSTVWDSQRRTHKLSNGQIIWDLAGNVDEWIYDDRASVGISPALSTGWQEASTLSANNRLLFGPANATWDSDEGIGQIYGDAAGGGIRRGGEYTYPVSRGIFAVWAGPDITAADGYSSFRCVYTP